MQKLILPILFVMIFLTPSKAQQKPIDFKETKVQQRLFDQPVQLKTCNISIETNSFIATTIIELEFYNSKDQEVEALQTFQLNRGQVITDFYLELDGKYREGSIEEQWKARQAYNSIVGKRIDPALLQMIWQSNYRLNIYPVPARSSRKVKFTITQMMQAQDSKLVYTLPLNFNSITSDFKLDIKVNKPVSIPYANPGILEDQIFTMGSYAASFLWLEKNIRLNKPVSFSINQFNNEPLICVSRHNNKSNFLMRIFPQVPAFYASKAKSINVYWDVSLSGKNRDLVKELDYLESFITENNVDKANVILFNHQMQGTLVFNKAAGNFSTIRSYLLNYNYNGATELGNLNFSNVLADMILLFSDCVNSVGIAQPKIGTVPINCILSKYNYNYYQVRDMINRAGGSVIALYNISVKDAVKKTDSAENFLYRYNSNHIKLNENFPLRLDRNILLSGTIDQSDNLEIIYGNNTRLHKSENYFLNANEICDADTYNKVRMLKAYDSLMYGESRSYNWQDMIVFGLTERVVTQQTSFLVLERIEDYITYKIAPPKELEEKCAEMNYVYKWDYKIKALRNFTEQDALQAVVKDYNKRINWWDKNEGLIDINRTLPTSQVAVAAATPGAHGNDAKNNSALIANDFAVSGNGLKEVVVTSAFGTKRMARSTASNVQNLSAEQINIIRGDNINNALAGKVAGIQVRSQSSGKLGAESIIRLRGENSFRLGTGPVYVVNGTIVPSANDINIDDVDDVTVLQAPAATALFGPDGINGAIVINLKKARRTYTSYNWNEYKLSAMEEVGYMQEMKAAEPYEIWETFLRLEKTNKNSVGFYFEMADFFFKANDTKNAQYLMYNAIELCGGSDQGLKLAAYMYEQWKYFDKAIAVYQGILSRNKNNLIVQRDLALAYYQSKNYEAAVRTYYDIVVAIVEDDVNMKEIALAELNAVLAMHKNEFDISYINFNLIKELPVDLRITIGSNYAYTRNLQIEEPDGTRCSWKNIQTKSGGRLTGTASTERYLTEYTIKKAVVGKYRIKIDANEIWNNSAKVPLFIRVVSFKNFQKANMTMQVKLFDLDNQYGVVELDSVNW